ncbi:MAG TPA: diguanylate cyclase [Solirubrobacteraceae bacterium]|jgi:PleD family two-component response regulator
MAASDTTTSDPPSTGGSLPADVLVERLEEEIARATRHHTALSCLLVGIEDPAAIERSHGKMLIEQALAYLGLALRREFRRYDRVGPTSEHDYLVVLPGADGARGEIVARRALQRLRAIKIEAGDMRDALGLIAGLATWREGQAAQELIAEARAAAGRRDPEHSSVSSSLPLGPLGLGSAIQI